MFKLMAALTPGVMNTLTPSRLTCLRLISFVICATLNPSKTGLLWHFPSDHSNDTAVPSANNMEKVAYIHNDRLTTVKETQVERLDWVNCYKLSCKWGRMSKYGCARSRGIAWNEKDKGKEGERGWGTILGIELRSQSWEPASLKQTVREKNDRTAS